MARKVINQVVVAECTRARVLMVTTSEGAHLEVETEQGYVSEFSLQDAKRAREFYWTCANAGNEDYEQASSRHREYAYRINKGYRRPSNVRARA